jgi:hypothetical protein
LIYVGIGIRIIRRTGTRTVIRVVIRINIGIATGTGIRIICCTAIS